MLLLANTALVLLLNIGLAPVSYGRLQAHGHQHGDILGRVLHKSAAISGSSLLSTKTHGRDTFISKPSMHVF